MEKCTSKDAIRWNRLKQRLENMWIERRGGWCSQDVATVNYVAGEDHMLKTVLKLMDQIDGTLDDEFR